MPTAVWTGTLSFGLVSVPVRLYPATEPKDVRFHQYDRAGRRLRYRRVVDEEPWEGNAEAPSRTAPSEDPSADAAPDERAIEDASSDEPRGSGEPGSPPTRATRDVDWGDVVLGRETETGETILVEREEVERLRPRRSATIEIEDFVDLDDIDPVFFDKTYYAVPRSVDEAKPYALLLRSMQRVGRVGIGRFVLRTKPHLVAVRPAAGVLAVETLFFGDEVRDAARLSPVDPATVDVAERELALAEQLIEMLGTAWDPSSYADTYRDELLALLASKEPEHRPAARPAVGAGGPIDALMAALKESVEEAKRQRSTEPGRDETRAG